MASTIGVEKLLSCDYPFRWSVQSEIDIVPDDMIERLTDQLNEKVFEEEFHFEQLMLYVGLAYENGLKNHIDKAVEILETGENKLREFKDSLSPSINDALRHIFLSTKAHLFLQKGDLDHVSSIISNIPLTDEKDKESKAALRGLRAVFFGEYGIDGTKVALGFASRAIKLNPGASLWYFLKGKYLGRIRRVERPYDVPQQEEREHLEKAIEFEKNPSYMVFTAQLYREAANRMFHLSKRNPAPREKSEIYELNLKALELYDESIKLKPKCPNMMFRCARGYINLPPPFRYERSERAGTLLEEGLKLAPNSGYGNHAMGQYYERVKKQPEEAMKYLKVCEKKKIFGGIMDIVRLEYQADKSIDLAQRLSNLLNVFPQKGRKCQLLSQLISYNLLVLTNVDEACSLASEVMRLDPDCADMTKHRPLTLFVNDPINLYEVILDDIRIQMPKVSKESKKCYENFMQDYMRTGKVVPPAEPRYLRSSICANSAQRKTFAPKNNNAPTRRDFQKPAHFRNQPEEEHSFKCNRKFSQRPEDSKNRKNNSYASNAAPSYNWRSRPPQESRKETVAEGTGLARKVDRNVPASLRDAPKNDDSDGDDFEFRMMIYEKSKKKAEPEQNRKASKLNDLVAPLQNMKIRDESAKETRIVAPKEDLLPKEEKRQNVSRLSDKKITTESTRIGAPKEDLLPKEEKQENVSKLSDKKITTESKNAEGGEEEHSDDSNRRSKHHKTHNSKHSRRRSYSRDDDDHDSKRRHGSKRSHRRKKDYSPDDEEERRYRDHRSSKHRSKHSRRSRSSESEDDDLTESRSAVSRRRDRRSPDRKSKRSHRRRSSSSESEDQSVDRGSVTSRRRNRGSVDRKSKRSHRRRSWSSGSGEANSDERRSVTSRRRNNRSAERKSKRHHRRRSSSSESEEDDSVERGSVASKRRDHRSPEHKSRNSRRRRSKDDRRRHHRSRDRELQKSRRKRHSSNSSDGSDHKSVPSKQSDSQGYYYKPENSHHKKPQKNSRGDDVDGTQSRSHEDHLRREEPPSHSEGRDDNFKPQCSEERESKNVGTGEGGSAQQSIVVGQGTSQSDGRDKHKPKHSSRDKDSDSESERRSHSSKRPHGSKYSHRKGSSGSEKDGSRRGADFSERGDGRSIAHGKRESKYSRRKGYSNHSEDEDKRESTSRRNDYHASSSNRRKYEGERSSKPRRSEDQPCTRERYREILEKVSKKYEPKSIFSGSSD